MSQRAFERSGFFTLLLNVSPFAIYVPHFIDIRDASAECKREAGSVTRCVFGRIWFRVMPRSAESAVKSLLSPYWSEVTFLLCGLAICPSSSCKSFHSNGTGGISFLKSIGHKKAVSRLSSWCFSFGNACRTFVKVRESLCFRELTPNTEFLPISDKKERFPADLIHLRVN